MSLLDAFLEDSLLNTVMQQEIWLAIRTDGVTGAGTELDPYNCAGTVSDSGTTRFDSIMAAIMLLPVPLIVRMQPGIYFTKGYNVTAHSGSWHPIGGMRIQGSGQDVTTIAFCNNGLANAALTCAIGLDYTATLIEGLQISDLSIDCASSVSLTGVTNGAVGGIAVSGRNILIERVHVKNMGTVGTGFDSFGISAARASSNTPYNCVIANCGVDSPGSNASANCIGLHFATENASYHENCIIRNCIVDFGITTTAGFGFGFCGISAGGGRGTIVEANQVRNCRYGGPALDKNITLDLIVRNNYYFNVLLGISESTAFGLTAMNRLIVLNNVFEWPDSTLVATAATGILLNGNGVSTVFGTVIIRGNVFRRINDSTPQMNDTDISLNGCTAVTVENNVVKVLTANNAFTHQACGTVQVFNTRATDGTFYPGYNSGTGLHDPELTTDVENALLAL